MKMESINTTLMCAALASTVCTSSIVASSEVVYEAEIKSSEVTTVETQQVPQRDTLVKMMKPMTVEFTDTRLEEVFAYITEQTGARLDIKWISDRYAVGLDKDQTITVTAAPGTALDLIERVLDEVELDFEQATWQMKKTGAIEVGPKSRLNAHKRVQIYDINDLLIEIPDFPDGPTLNIQQALRGSGGGGGGGGGGGQPPFTDGNQNNRDERKTRDEKAQEVIDMIVELVEPEQWVDSGGDAATIRHWRGALLVNGPDYIHRQISGYPYWTNGVNRHAATTTGRRYVQMTPDTGISTIEGFANEEVVAVVGGRIIRSGKPGGGGE